MNMSSRERVAAVLDRRPADRLPIHESFWSETRKRWVGEGRVGEEEGLLDHFGLDIRAGGWPTLVANLDFEEQVLEETGETVLKRDGNGATLRRMKTRAGVPEHVDFAVRDRATWEEYARPHLVTLDTRRIPFDSYGESRRAAAQQERFFFWNSVGPFECMHPVCGHEYMLMGMAMDPGWIKDMVEVYCTLTVKIMEELFTREGAPDGVWFFEDMGFKGRPFMSPEMYRELIQPGHAMLFDYAHSRGLKVVVHSCGYVEPLVPGLIEAGMDCLQAMEVKAGMDVVDLGKRFGDRISFCGGLDIRELISNDRDRVDAEMEKKIPALLEMGCGYIVHSDHSVPSEVDYESMVHWVNRAQRFAPVA